MVAGIQQQPHGQSLQQQQQQPPLTTAEEEALKRNTDCVYFLASPLTCKKGSECEYRHSEYARVNPRDCWFWLNGNCLNPKCAFRHPPLDGLLGNQVATSAGSSVPASHTAPSPVTQAPYNPGKQPVPCIFFQKGYCLKGDKCAFLHGPNPVSVKVSQAPVASHGSESLNFKAPGGLQKCSQEQRVPKTNIMNAVGFPPQASSAMRVETSLPKNGVSNKSNAPSIKAFDDEGLRYKAITTTASNGNSTSRSNRSHQVIVSDDQDFQNGKDNNDEYFRESSPGFDVLVDNELSDPDYFHSEDQFGKARGRDGRNLNSVDEYDMDSSMDYRSAADVDRKRYHDSTGYDSYDPVQGMSAWDQRGTSAERIGVGPAHLDRRGYRESGSPDQAYESDLRYRLSKQRRVGGLRSVVSNNHTMDNHGEERSNRGSSRRDSHQLPLNERSVSSRLRGRIKVPGESSSIDGGNIRPDREVDRGRNWGRLSPSRPQISSHQGRLRERIKGKVQEDYSKDGRNFLDMHIRREIMDERDTGFDGPKSLAQLKGGKNSISKEQSHLGKRKNMRTMESQQSEGDASFDGPMPLSEILKRKRQAQAAGSGIAKSSSDKEDNNPTVKSVSGGGSRAYNAEMQPGLSATSKEYNDNNLLSNKNGSKSAATDVAGAESEALGDIDAEDEVIYEETTGDQLLGAEDQRDGDYDYDQGDEGDYNYDGENVDPEEEYLEDEDGDDFAKKIGVLTS